MSNPIFEHITKRLILYTPGLVTCFSIFMLLTPVIAQAGPCPKVQCANFDVLKAEWSDSDQQYLKGRKSLTYYFLNEPVTFDACSLGDCATITTVAYNKNITRVAKAQLKKLSETINISFREMSPPNPENPDTIADITIALVKYPGSSQYGQAAEFKAYPTKTVLLLNTNITQRDVSEIFHGHYFLHELGHILGLKHPFDGNSRKPQPCNFSADAFGTNAITTDQTLMAYKTGSNQDMSWYRPLDIATLCRIWGAKHK